jgi:hypothetical protein
MRPRTVAGSRAGEAIGIAVKDGGAAVMDAVRAHAVVVSLSLLLGLLLISVGLILPTATG